MEAFILIMVFMTTFLLVIVFYFLLNSNKISIKNRMENIKLSGNLNYDENDSADQVNVESTKNRVEKIHFFSSYYEKKRKKLSQSYILMKPGEFLLVSITFGLIMFLVLYLIANVLLIGIIGFIIGFKIPDLYVNSVKKNRGKKLNNQLPEALNVISNGLRAGLSFSQAISIAGKELDSPISDELSKVLRDNTLGKSMDDALIDLTNRTDDEDIDMFVTAMIIQRQVGGNLSEILDTISFTIRERVKLKGEVQTLTAQSKLSAVIISLLPLGIIVILYFMNPDYINLLFKTTFGLVIVGISVVLQAIGISVLISMTKLKI